VDREIYGRMREVEDRHWWFRGRRGIVTQTLADLGLSRSCQILDAGCGTGGNLELLSGFGTTTGMEADDEALAFASERGSAAVMKGYLPDGMPSFGRKFDLVVLLDVLEHIDRDRESLAALRTVMQPGAHVLITVPAFSFLWSKHDEIHHHKRRYVKSSLQSVIEAAGLKTIRMTYFNTVLFPLIAAVRLKERYLPPQDAMGELTVPGAAVNGVLESVLRFEGGVLRRVGLPFGVSLLAIARNDG
jgi:2-polyprenyl-3-methyl-5-hydroxy-6-metoxy-1,4-benzoquinol methylase